MCCYIFKYFTASRKIENKKILVIGGTKGLGLSIASILLESNNKVCVAARKIDNVDNRFSKLLLDVTQKNTFPTKKTNYDYIFCCAGVAKPGMVQDLDISDYRQQMEINYFGTLNALFHYKKYNKKPFKFIMISSTTALFTFPGYSAYAPSKAALKSFFDSSFLEFKNQNIELYIYYANSIKTPGFESENSIKPAYTQEIEGEDAMPPDVAARILLDSMAINNEICSDHMTQIFKVKSESKNIVDTFYFMLSLLVYPFAVIYTRFKYNRMDGRKND